MRNINQPKDKYIDTYAFKYRMLIMYLVFCLKMSYVKKRHF